jgi:hypothetical protein
VHLELLHLPGEMNIISFQDIPAFLSYLIYT